MKTESGTHRAVDVLIEQERRFTIKACVKIARTVAEQLTCPRDRIVAEKIAKKIEDME